MQAISLIICMADLVIVSMDLALAIIWNKRARYQWTAYCIVFAATLLGVVVLFTLDQYSTLVFSGTVQAILHLVWEILLIGDSAFILVFLCYFVNWVIAQPMARWAKYMAFVFGIMYAVFSVLSLLSDLRIFEILQYSIACLMVCYCISILMMYKKFIEQRYVRIVCNTLFIVTASSLPLIVLALIFESQRASFLSLTGLAHFISFMVFLFLAIERQEDNTQQAAPRDEITLDDVSRFHITERELDVIKLIKKGLTNKEIASELCISVNTVNNHIANIFAKTEVRSRIDLLNLLQEASW